MRRGPPRIVCADRGGALAGDAFSDIAVPPGLSTLDVALAVLECFVNEHGGVLNGVELLADGSGTYTVRIPVAPRGPEEA